MRVYLKITRRILREAEAPKASLSQGRVGRTWGRVAEWLILLPNVGSSPDLAARELLALFHGPRGLGVAGAPAPRQDFTLA